MLPRHIRWVLMPVLAAVLLTGCRAMEELRRPAERLTIAFCNAEGLPPEQAGRLAEGIRNRYATCVWYRGPDELFYSGRPISKLAPAVNGWHRRILDAERFEAAQPHPCEVFVLKSDDGWDARSESIRDLLRALSMSDAEWKLVLMEKSLVLPEVDRERIWLTRLLQREGVALAISCDEGRYARTIPIGPDAAHCVRYINLGVGRRAEESERDAPLASAIEEPNYVICTVTDSQLTWIAYGLDGTILDTVIVEPGATPAAFRSLMELRARGIRGDDVTASQAADPTDETETE